MTTERDVLDLLGRRYGRVGGNGEHFVVAEHVRSQAGFDARRTCDFMAWSLWPSEELVLHGHEVKVSRGDWLRELREPAKAREFMVLCDYWWLVCPPHVAAEDELPAGWGLMEVGASGERLSVKVHAPRLLERAASRDDWWVPRSFAVAFMRAAVRTSRSAAAPPETLGPAAGDPL